MFCKIGFGLLHVFQGLQVGYCLFVQAAVFREKGFQVEVSVVKGNDFFQGTLVFVFARDSARVGRWSSPENLSLRVGETGTAMVSSSKSPGMSGTGAGVYKASILAVSLASNSFISLYSLSFTIQK